MSERIQLGVRGRTIGPLRPAGKIQIEGQTFDARSEGTWIDADAEVVVAGSDSFGVVVRLATDADEKQTANSDAVPGWVSDPTGLRENAGAETQPTALVERVGARLGAIIGCALIPVVWLAGEPLSMFALLPPVAGAVAGEIFRWCVGGASGFAGPSANHRPVAYFIAAIMIPCAAMGILMGALSFGFLGLSAGFVLGTMFGGLVAWGMILLS